MTPDSAGKQLLRRSVLQRLQALPPAGRDLRSAALRRLLAPYLHRPEPLRVALYAALPHEVDLLPLIKEYPQHIFCFPRCLPQHRMSFHHVTQADTQLIPAAMGIPAPLAELATVDAEAFDLVVVPGVAFTERGDRLGYGGGYYDRFLPRCRRARILALAFTEQIYPRLPTEEHDFLIPQVLHL